MTTGKSAHGILVGLREVVTASTIVLCAGLGQSAIMSTVSSRMEGRLKSRVDVMMAFRNVRLRNPLRCLEYGGPTLIPTDHGFALASRYGGSQPRATRIGRWPVPMDVAHEIMHQLRRYFSADLVDLDTGRAYTCTKTEVRGSHADAWGVEPGYAVIDHTSLDGLNGLFPESHTPLELPEHRGVVEHATRDLIAEVPWRMADEVAGDAGSSHPCYSPGAKKG